MLRSSTKQRATETASYQASDPILSINHTQHPEGERADPPRGYRPGNVAARSGSVQDTGWGEASTAGRAAQPRCSKQRKKHRHVQDDLLPSKKFGRNSCGPWQLGANTEQQLRELRMLFADLPAAGTSGPATARRSPAKKGSLLAPNASGALFLRAQTCWETPPGEPACTGATLEAGQRQLTLPAAARGSPAAASSPCSHIIKSSSSSVGKSESKIKARRAAFQVARVRLSHSPASPGVLGSE